MKTTVEEFRKEFRDLCKYMGTPITTVRDEQAESWYSIFRFETLGTIREAFKMAASRTQRSFPNLSEVKGCISAARAKAESKTPTGLKCSFCEGAGTVIGIDNMAYRCACEAGERFAKNFRVIPRTKIQPIDRELTGRFLTSEAAARCMEVIRESFSHKRSGQETWELVREKIQEHQP